MPTKHRHYISYLRYNYNSYSQTIWNLVEEMDR